MNRSYIHEVYENSNNPEMLKYMSPNQIFQLYLKKEIGISDVVKYTRLSDLITAPITAEEKIEILTSGNGSRIYNHSESDIIWEYFEKDYFNSEQMAALEKLRCFHLNAVIRNYKEDKNRKIAKELGVVPVVSEEKLFLIFTPEIILRELRKGVNDENRDFYNIDLKRIYDEKTKEYGESEDRIVNDKENESTQGHKGKIEQAVISTMLAEYREKNKSITEFYKECLDLYDKGFLSLDSLVDIKLPEDVAAKYISMHNNERSLLIKFFNAKIISQDYIIDLYPDDFEDRALELIDDGMSARVVSGMYSTGELIERSGIIDSNAADKIEEHEERPKTIGLDGLAELKDEIKTGLEEDKEDGKSKNRVGKEETTILSLYLDNSLTYENLRAFAEAGVISEDEFFAIEDKYNVSGALKKLKQNGLFSRKIYGQTESAGPHVSKTNRSKKAENSDSILGKGIDRELIKMFYEALGMEPEDFVAVDATKCPIFEGYTLITDVKRRLCYLRRR